MIRSVDRWRRSVPSTDDKERAALACVRRRPEPAQPQHRPGSPRAEHGTPCSPRDSSSSSDGGFLGTLAAFGLLLLLRFSLIWVGVWLGLLMPSPEAAGSLYAVVFPLTMISNVFVAPSTMPGWLGTLASWNPISSTATAIRELFGNPVGGDGSWISENALLMAVVWPVAITLLCLPMAVRRFQRLSR